jgi:hypothetical protein
MSGPNRPDGMLLPSSGDRLLSRLSGKWAFHAESARETEQRCCVMTTIDYPAALDSNDIERVVAGIQDNYSTHEIHIHDAATLHFGYWSKSERCVATTLLQDIQAAGYSLIQAGHEQAPESKEWHGWMECRKYAPGERARTLTCPRCEHTFTPVTVTYQIVGAGSAYYSCPECSNRLEASPPCPATSDSPGGETR